MSSHFKGKKNQQTNVKNEIALALVNKFGKIIKKITKVNLIAGNDNNNFS